MLQGLRAGAPLYIFNRNEVALAIGEVVSCNQSQQFPNVTPTNWAQMPTLVVDVVARVNGQEYTYPKLPANQVIADVQGTALVVSESREAIINEIERCRKESERVLADVDRHKQIVERCGEMIAELNPQIKIEAQREKELQELRDQVGELASVKNELTELKKLLAASLKTSNKKSE